MSSIEEWKSNGYVVIPKILSGELLDFVGIHAYNRARLEGPNPEDPQVPNTPSFYCDYVIENLSDFLLPKIESVSGVKLFPTYTYYRVYKAGDILHNHRDRPSCEVSISLCVRRLKHERIWPIYVNNEQYKKEHITGKGSTNPLLLEEGDAVLYRGMEIDHWREPYEEGTKLAQVFLHYVDANGPYSSWKDDQGKNSYFAVDK